MVNVVPLGGARYLAGIAGYFTASVAVLRATTTTNEFNEDVPTWEILEGHADVPAHIGTGDVGIRLKNQEFRTSQVVNEVQRRRVFLAGAYSEVKVTDRLRFEGQDWAIVSVVVDSTSTITEVLAEDMNPGNI